MDTNTATFDFTPAYTVAGHAGVAWSAIDFVKEWEPTRSLVTVYEDDDDAEGYDVEMDDPYDGEWVPRTDQVVCRMVGDDMDFIFDVEDLTPIADEDYCGGCGQIGCGW